MKVQRLQRVSMRLTVALAICATTACQLVTGVDELRVESETKGNTDDSDDPSDASSTNDSDDNDETRTEPTDTPDGALDDGGGATTGVTSGSAGGPGTTGVSGGTGSASLEAGVSPTSHSDGGNTECEIPATLTCAPITNCGCEDGTVCTVAESDGEYMLNCSEPGTADVGAACEPGECKSGSHCWQGICRQACARDADCEEEGASCNPLDGDGPILSKLRYCDAPCDLLSPAQPRAGLHACGEDQTCVRAASSTVCAASVGHGTWGAVCERDIDCAMGLGCVDETCKPWCNPDGASCGEWAACVAADDVTGVAAPTGTCEGSCEMSDVPGSECGVLPDCGCSAGQTCRVIDSVGLTACSSVGSASDQASCQTDTDCTLGLSCVDGLCRPYCDAETACAELGTCFGLYFGETETVDVGICGGSCDPVWPDTDDDTVTPCGNEALCQPGVLGGAEAPRCVATGGVGLVDYGETCEPSQDYCQIGAVCTGTCEVLCRSNTDCSWTETAGAECLQAGDIFLDTNGSELGVCCLMGPVEGSECGAFGQDCGCVEDEACRLATDSGGAIYVDGRTACSATGEVGTQELCESDVDCIRGHSCVDSICRPHCGEGCAENQGTCVQISVDDTPIPGATVCLGLCNPANTTESNDEWGGCGEGVRCVPGIVGSDDYPLAECEPSSGDLDVGDACVNFADCLEGLACVCDDETCEATTCQTVCFEDEDCGDGRYCELESLLQIKPDVPIGYCVTE
jgi:hypothetical protein